MTVVVEDAKRRGLNVAQSGQAIADASITIPIPICLLRVA